MNTGILVLLIVLAVLLFGLCILLMVIMQRQNTISKHLQNQQAQSQAESAAALQETRVRFGVMEERLSNLLKEQNTGTAIMDQLASQMDGITRIMTNTKLRGSWGEYQMESLIRIYAGDSPEIYEVQYHLENGKIADGAFHIPGSKKVLCIDSKFPLENWMHMEEYPEDQDYYQKEFRKNMKKHIDDVAGKYITPQTANMAMLFIPSESIYEYVCGSCGDLYQYALKKKVLLVSPTTLAGVIFSLLSSTKDFYRSENIAQIEKELLKVQDEFEKLIEKADKADRAVKTCMNQIQALNISLKKSVDHLNTVLEGSPDAKGRNSSGQNLDGWKDADSDRNADLALAGNESRAADTLLDPDSRRLQEPEPAASGQASSSSLLERRMRHAQPDFYSFDRKKDGK